MNGRTIADELAWHRRQLDDAQARRRRYQAMGGDLPHHMTLGLLYGPPYRMAVDDIDRHEREITRLEALAGKEPT